MLDRGKLKLLGVLIDGVDYQASVERIIASAKAGEPLSVSALAVHGVMTGVLNKTHRYRLNHLGLVVPDGQPVRWALNLIHGAKLPDRVYGPTLMLKTCEAAANSNLSIFLFGSDIETLESLKENLKAKYPNLTIAGIRASRFRQLSSSESQELIQEIRDSKARICFVGLGCPRQETFAYEVCDLLQMPTLAVGAAFAFHAGHLSQAPEWMQKHGLEWFYRFCREPVRLWKRYALLNPLYIALVALQLLGLHNIDSDDAVVPSIESRFG